MVNVDISAYSLDTDNGNMKGYYAKVIKMKKQQMDNALEVNEDNSL